MQWTNWFLTYPRWSNEASTFEDIKKALDEAVAAKNRAITQAIIAKEHHGDGGLHYHIYFKVDKKFRWNAEKEVRLFDIEENHPKVDVDIRSVDAVIKYCQKEGEYKTWNIDLKARAQKRKATNLEMFQRNPLEMAEEGSISPAQYLQIVKAQAHYKLHREGALTTENTRGTWIWGMAGIGKSHKARLESGVDAEEVYIKAQNKWWDGYTGQKVVVLDDLDTDCLCHYLKIWADKWACSGEVKGGTVPLRHEKFIVTSNYPVEHFCKQKDGMVDQDLLEALNRRFKVIHLQQMEQWDRT